MKEMNELGEIKPKIGGFFSLSTQNMPFFLPHDVVPYTQNIWHVTYLSLSLFVEAFLIVLGERKLI